MFIIKFYYFWHLKTKFMKKSIIIFIFSFLGIICNSAYSQHLEIVPLVNYQFPAGVDATWWNPNTLQYEYGRIRIQGNVNYGVGLNIPLPMRGITVSASFTTMNSSVEWQPNFGTKRNLFDATQEYWMFGFLKEIDRDQLRPYGGLILGWTTIRPDDPIYNNASKFSAGLEGGVKYFISNNVGILLHARLLIPVQWVGAGFSIGTGGSGAGLSMGSSIVQGDIGGGIVIALGKK